MNAPKHTVPTASHPAPDQFLILGGRGASVANQLTGADTVSSPVVACHPIIYRYQT
jgi:hypothetical protein